MTTPCRSLTPLTGGAAAEEDASKTSQPEVAEVAVIRCRCVPEVSAINK